MFWRQFTPANCLPDNCDCEFIQLDQWIAQPSAFWSSLAYIFFALLLYWYVPKNTPNLKKWTMCFIFVGLCSMFAHASFIEFSMAMDFAGIILILSFFFLIKILNRFVETPWKITVLLLAYQGGLWITFYSLDKWFKVALCLLIFIGAIVEIIHSQGKTFLKARDLHKSLVIVGVSFVFFLTDELKLICDPHSWIQAHSVWHVGSSVALFLYGKWRFSEYMGIQKT